MDAARAAIENHKCRIKELEANCTKLENLIDYLSSLPADLVPAMPQTGAIESVIQSNAVPSQKLSLTPDEIARKAYDLLRSRGAGRYIRAMDIALAIDPGYDRYADDRNFENRVYSVLKRRPDDFIKIGKKGQWTLKEFVNHNSAAPGDE